jgi:cobalt-zinc-cadmium resistance protein CzcA
MLQITQPLGSVLTHIQRGKYINQQIALEETNLDLSRRQLEREVKSAYLSWVYERELLQQRQRELDLYQGFGERVNLQYESGESDLLVKTLSDAQFARATNALQKQEDQVKIAFNRLSQLLYDELDEKVAPSADTLARIAANAGSVFPTEQHLLMSRGLRRLNLMEAATSLEKSRFFPGLSVGYFNQNITDREVQLTNLQGWQVGISFPLWFMPQKSRISQARIAEQQAQNDLDYLQYTIDHEVEKLLLQAQQAEKQLNYYEQTALPQSEIIFRTAGLQLAEGEIDYFRYLQSISTAIELRMAYLSSLNDYNQAIIQLEYYR